jgi:metallophosphoesterase superfamily enzyme
MNLKARLEQFSKQHSERALVVCRDLKDRVEKAKQERERERIFLRALRHIAKEEHNG